ncbi:MAG: 3-phosphoglycerate dehydrogenase [Anaerolineae bacterium]|nr:3-phosphoglycerate dehydrogenase [Anaerolineae bacterium]
MKLRILNIEPQDYSPQALAILQSVGEVTEAPLSRAELLAALPAYDVLITRLAHQIDAEALATGLRLRAVASATTGLDHIDLHAAAAQGVTVLSLRGETAFLRGIYATAEHTWGLLLALLRRIPQAHQAVLAGAWQRDRFRGGELQGKTLGILGLGRLGEKVARYGLAFEMRVLAHDTDPLRAEPGVQRVGSLEALLGAVDVLSVHVPLNSETQHLLGAAQLAQMRPGALLVNTARGAILDEAALVAALQSGHLGGAALDVLEDEAHFPAPGARALLDYAVQHPNLIITPHIGGATHESMARTEVFIAQKIKRFLEDG